MPTTAETINAYLHAWNESDEAERRVLLERAWADDGVYIDPITEARGRDALSGAIAAMHAAQPGARIALTSGVDQHHNQVRFKWAFIDAGGTTQIAGIDVGELAPDGRIARITGFWAEPPPR